MRRDYAPFRACHHQGLARNPELRRRISVKFVVGRDGKVAETVTKGRDVPDQAGVDCVVNTLQNLEFPKPEGGVVTVVYPVMISPA